MPVVASVCRRLEQFGIAAQSRVEIGEPDDVIPKCAEEEHCDAVVIGAAPANAIKHFLARRLGIVLGTTASLAALSERPLILVK